MIVIVHNVRSLHNVGSIFRTADGAGVKKIYLTGYTPSPLDKHGEKIPQLAKVSLNAEDYIEWEKINDLNKLISKLKKEGYKILAIEQDQRSVPYFKAKPKGKFALVLGNEVKGLSKSALKKCDHVLEIPMRGKKESLNVSVAFGIVAHHLANL